MAGPKTRVYVGRSVKKNVSKSSLSPTKNDGGLNTYAVRGDQTTIIPRRNMSVSSLSPVKNKSADGRNERTYAVRGRQVTMTPATFRTKGPVKPAKPKMNAGMKAGKPTYDAPADAATGTFNARRARDTRQLVNFGYTKPRYVSLSEFLGIKPKNRKTGK